MYSREIGFSNSRENYTADGLRSRYVASTSPRRTPFKVQSDTTHTDEKTENLPAAPTVTPSAETETSNDGDAAKNFIQTLEGDDLLMLSVLALLLFSNGEKKNFDIILAAALLFVEFA